MLWIEFRVSLERFFALHEQVPEQSQSQIEINSEEG